MTWKTLVLNVLIIGTLVVITTVLSGNKPLNLTWFTAFVILSALFQYYLGEYNKLKQENSQLISEKEELNRQLGLQILKASREGNNFFDIAIYPNLYGNTLKVNESYALQIFVNSVYQITKIPDVLFTTNKKWKIYDKFNHEIIPFEHNDKYLFTLKNCKVTSQANKYFIYECIVIFLESGENEISILTECRDLRSEVKNTFDISI